MDQKRSRVCVTGAAGYIGSWLVKKLLEKGYTVHATLRNLGDSKKTKVLKGLPWAEERLELFEADMYDAGTFESAIRGCEFVFLLATPLQHNPNSSKYQDTTEAVVDATRIILQQCEQAKTVKRVIHTASVTAASPLKEDSTGFKDFIDESCWTPLDLSYGYTNVHLDAYVSSKTLSEKELLNYNDNAEKRGFEVVTLACGLVGGETIQSYLSDSLHVIVSPFTGTEICHNALKFLQDLLGSVPLVHVDDVCEAHVFCIERPSMAGRFLCAAAYPAMQEFVDHYAKKYPELKLIREVAGKGVTVQANTNKLADLGFNYKYGVEEILDGSVECAKRLGVL